MRGHSRDNRPGTGEQLARDRSRFSYGVLCKKVLSRVQALVLAAFLFFLCSSRKVSFIWREFGGVPGGPGGRCNEPTLQARPHHDHSDCTCARPGCDVALLFCTGTGLSRHPQTLHADLDITSQDTLSKISVVWEVPRLI